LALKKGNFYIGTGDVGKGPTSSTGFYHGVTPPSGGFTIYLNKASDGPAIYTVSTEAQLTSLTNRIAGTNYTTSGECLNYFATQTDKIIFNRDYSPIITNGLVLNMDAGFTPSYPTIGTTWYNVGPVSSNGTFTNSPIYSPLSGGSISFDGVDDYIDVSSVYPSIPTEISIESYFRLNSYSNLFYNEFKPRFAIRSSSVNLWHGTDAYGNIAFSYNFTTGVWYHIVLTFDTTNKYLCYVNGVSLSRTYDNFAANGIPGFTTTVIGSSAGSEPYFNGNMQSAKFYNRALSQSEILKNYFATIPIIRNGLVLNLEAGNPTSYFSGSKSWVDTAGGTIGALTNGPTFSSSGASSNIVFDGVDDYVAWPNNPLSSLTSAKTYDVWVKFTNAQNTFTLGCGTLNVYLQNNNVWYINQVGASAINISGWAFSSGWTNFIYSFDGTNHLCYINGVSYVVNSGGGVNSQTVLYIGSRVNLDSFLKGNIATTRVYNRGLSATEILQNFNAQRTAFGI
jgi:hypothetical protein